MDVDTQGEWKMRYNCGMKTKPITFLLALTFLFLISGSSIVFGDDYQDGVDTYERNDYKEALRLFRLLAEQGDAEAQSNYYPWCYPQQKIG